MHIIQTLISLDNIETPISRYHIGTFAIAKEDYVKVQRKVSNTKIINLLVVCWRKVKNVDSRDAWKYCVYNIRTSN